MKKIGILGNLNGVVFVVALLAIFSLELLGKVVEKGVGYYLKWENHERPQLGRIWERDREKIVAQKKIENILSSLNAQEQDSESLKSFKELFEKLSPSESQMVSRKKFLQLYFEFPEQLAYKIVSPYDLLEIDSKRDWQRVLFTQYGEWITISFVNTQTQPIREVFLSSEGMDGDPMRRDILQGPLDEGEFGTSLILPFDEFMRVLRTLDPEAQKKLFPNPYWFFSKNYHISRVGVKEDTSSDIYPPPVLLGVEYQNDLYTEVLVLPVPSEISDNLLSQMEIPVFDEGPEAVSPFGDYQDEGGLN